MGGGGTAEWQHRLQTRRSVHANLGRCLPTRHSAQTILGRAQSLAQVDSHEHQLVDGIRVGYSTLADVSGLIGRDYEERARLESLASGKQGMFKQCQAQTQLRALAAHAGATYDALGFSHQLHATAPTAVPAAPAARAKPSTWPYQTALRSNTAISSAWPAGTAMPPQPRGYAGHVLVPGAPAPHFHPR